MHKCQGMSQLLPLPAPISGGGGFGPLWAGRRARNRLRHSALEGGVARADKEMFDGASIRACAAC